MVDNVEPQVLKQMGFDVGVDVCAPNPLINYDQK